MTSGQGAGSSGPTTLREAMDTIAELRRALEARTVIGCALGVLMERHGVDRDAAAALLCRTSRQRREPIVSVAQLVLEGRDDDVSPEAGRAGAEQ